MLLEKKNIICIEVDRFKTEIIRASRDFIPGPGPKLLREAAGAEGCYRTPRP